VQPPQAVFTELFPILSTPDLPRALGFYRDLLGASVTYEFAAPDGEPGYVGLQLAGSHFGIGRADAAAEAASDGDQPRPISLWVYADDCDAAVDRLQKARVTITEQPTDQPWGERVARVRDPDGNEVIIGSRAPAAPALGQAAPAMDPEP
jgi:lactoylglutathione lyase